MSLRRARRPRSRLKAEVSPLTRWLSEARKADERGMPLVRTTDNQLIPFDRSYIVRSLVKETQLAEEYFGVQPIKAYEAEEIAAEAEARIRRMDPPFVSGAVIREVVNNILLERAAKNPRFYLYRNLYARVGLPVYDAHEIVFWRGFEARENSNLERNRETAHKKMSDKTYKELALYLMPPELADGHISGDYHIHDLEYFVDSPFCQNWDLRIFLYTGLVVDGSGHFTSVAGPAKHPEVAILHSAKVLEAAQVNFSGGQGFMYWNMFLAPYLEGLSYREVKQLAQMFVYEITQMYVARGGQPVFSNIQLVPGIPEIWRDVPAVKAGRKLSDTYGDFEDEARALFRAVTEVALEGDYMGKPFNFPKREYHFSPDLIGSEYEEEWLLVHREIAKFGGSYIDNMVPPYRMYGRGVSCYQCCAYTFTSGPESDPKFYDKLYLEGGEHFSLGGKQVVTVNLPRIAYRANGNDALVPELLREVVSKIVKVFEVKEKWLRKQLENYGIPFAQYRPRDPVTGEKLPPLVDMDSLVYTIGVLGGNEMAQYHTGYQLHESKEAVRFLVKTILQLREIVKELREETGLPLVLARTPAESAAQRLAIADLVNRKFREKAKSVVKGDVETAAASIAAGERRNLPVYYSNGTHVYVGARIPLARKIEIEQKFFPILGEGGNMFHIWLGEAHPDPEALWGLTKKIALGSQIGYFAYTKDFTICKSCHRVSPLLNESCPHCGSKAVTYWSRITGYYSNVEGWNSGKLRELRDRYRISL